MARRRTCNHCGKAAGPKGQCQSCARAFYVPKHDGISDADDVAGIVRSVPTADGYETFVQTRRSRKRIVNDARGDFILKV
jgi:hypothetical protein